MKVTCAICKKEFEVTEAQYKIMEKIGLDSITCNYQCAVKLVSRG